MANSWFRLYSEFAVDPKVQMLSENYQRRLIMLFCFRCSNDNETLHDTEIAFQLRISEPEWAETKAVFVARNFITDDNEVINWDKRQFVSDSSTSRVYKHRERKKQECNVSVTAPDTDSDTETDTEKEESKTLVVAGLDADVWKRWLAYRKQIRKPLKPASILAAQRKLAAFGSSQAAVVEQTIANGWTGLFELKSNHAQPGKVNGYHRKTQDELLAEQRRKIEELGKNERAIASTAKRLD